jgi:hypothetical protein
MGAVHEVTDPDGQCLYRGLDVNLACEIYERAPAGSRLSWHRVGEPATRRRVHLAPSADEPVPYELTSAGRAATDDESVYWLTPQGYAASMRSAMFVVDTADVDDLRRRCPELFAPRRQTGAAS